MEYGLLLDTGVLPQSELEGKIIGLKHGACLMEGEPMPVDRRHFTGAQKLAILREHLLDKTPISDVCQKHDIQPTLFYLWQKKLFEDGAAVFDSKAANARQLNADAQKVQALQAKLQQKNEVLAELMGEHLDLKKSLGLI
jgi:transposase-like protein